MLDVSELRSRARREALELGPQPATDRERKLWVEERHDTAVLLAMLAGYDRDLLKRAAWLDWISTGAQDLLLAAAQECH